MVYYSMIQQHIKKLQQHAEACEVVAQQKIRIEKPSWLDAQNEAQKLANKALISRLSEISFYKSLKRG